MSCDKYPQKQLHEGTVLLGSQFKIAVSHGGSGVVAAGHTASAVMKQKAMGAGAQLTSVYPAQDPSPGKGVLLLGWVFPPQSDQETPSWACQDARFEILSRRPSVLTITGAVWEEGTESGGSLGRKVNGGAYGQSTQYT